MFFSSCTPKLQCICLELEHGLQEISAFAISVTKFLPLLPQDKSRQTSVPDDETPPQNPNSTTENELRYQELESAGTFSKGSWIVVCEGTYKVFPSRSEAASYIAQLGPCDPNNPPFLKECGGTQP